jgi:hypothetical protein
MQKFSRFPDLVQAGYVNNRMTLQRWMDRGIFPPPCDLGPNSVAWADEDLAEYSERARAGVTEPNLTWLGRLAKRKARMAARSAT